MKDFVSYEIALALKELGFDDKCFGAYDKKYKLAISTSDYWDKSSLYSLNDYFGKNTYRCLAPLYQQAFRWFREKYSYQSFISPSNELTYLAYDFTLKGFDGYFKSKQFKTYEEAEFECLKKLIEIVK
jgi:hypothetical protein